MSGAHPIKAMDVKIANNKNKILFILRSSKPHLSTSTPQLVKITGLKHRNANTANNIFCPFSILREFLIVHPNCKHKDEPIFIFADHSLVQPRHMRCILKLILSLAGFQADLYDTHSLRIGRCVDLLNWGISVETIKKLGRCKSNCVFRYLSQA